MLHDLVCADIIRLDEKNQIDEKEKIQTIPQPKAFVRFIIRSAMIQPDDNCPDECWKDRTLQESYIAYTREQQKEKGLCYLTGNRETISYLHPKKIRNEGDGAMTVRILHIAADFPIRRKPLQWVVKRPRRCITH